MAAIASQTVSRNGLAATFSACSAGGDTFTPGSSTYLHFKNTNASTKTVTITPAIAGGPLGQTISAFSMAVPPTTGDKEWGPFPSYPFAQADGTCALAYTADATNLTVAVKIYAE